MTYYDTIHMIGLNFINGTTIKYAAAGEQRNNKSQIIKIGDPRTGKRQHLNIWVNNATLK